MRRDGLAELGPARRSLAPVPEGYPRLRVSDLARDIVPAARHRAVAVDVPGSELGEHPLWVDDALVWVDIPAGRVHRWVPGAEVTSLALGEPVSLAWPASAGCPVSDQSPGAPGSLVLALPSGVRVIGPDGWNATLRSADIRPPGGAARPSGSADSFRTPPLTPPLPAGWRWNDGACDAAGRLWLATMSPDPGRVPGALYRICATEPDAPAAVTPMIGRLPCGNGIAWSPAGDVMYIVESLTRTVRSFEFDSSTGELGAESVAWAFDLDGPMPDGMVADAAGRLWVAWWGGGCVLCLDPRAPGHAVAVIEVATRLVTALAFGPGGSDTVYLTTAQDAAGGGGVYQARMDVVAAATNPFGPRDAMA